MAKLAEKGMCLESKSSHEVNGHWYKLVCSSQLDVLRHFSSFHLVCYSTCFSGIAIERSLN